MEKILLRKISINFIIAGIIVVSLYSLGTYKKYKEMAFYTCEQLLNQIGDYYKDAQTNLEDKFKLYKEDYINRAYAIDFILKNNINMRNSEGLKKIKDLMGVDSIYLVDRNGKIALSNEKELIGINFLEYEEDYEFCELIKDSNQDDSEVNMDDSKILEGKESCFVGIKSSVEDYSMLKIEFNKKTIDELKREASIDMILNDTPTIYDTTIFAIDKTNGNILGMTENNEQSIDFNSIKSDEELINLLSKSSNGIIVKINGVYKFLKCKIIDNIILVGYKDAKNLVNQLIIRFLYCASIVCSIFFILMITLKKYLKKYIFNDFNKIENSIKEIISGQLNTSFKAGNIELQSLVQTLNSWKDIYKHKSNRMSKMISNIGGNVCLFECIHYINKNFYSDNLQYTLGVDDEKWNQIKKSPIALENYIKSIISLENDEGVIYINNKYLVIKSYTIQNEFFGIIIDKSAEIKKNKKMIEKLEEVKCAAEKDSLTNLLNRNAFEKYVEESLVKKPGKGIMLIFDLDNFKQINDTLGHPEGDRVLRLISCCLNDEFRQNEIIGRLGGDEFVVFIDENMPLEELEIKLEALLNTIRKTLYNYYKKYNVSLSIGVAYVNNKIYDYQDLYRCSDSALYIAKGLGKDGYYVNEDNIRCIREKCVECTSDCKKKKALGL